MIPDQMELSRYLVPVHFLLEMQSAKSLIFDLLRVLTKSCDTYDKDCSIKALRNVRVTTYDISSEHEPI
jgi:hypothetical protein